MKKQNFNIVHKNVKEHLKLFSITKIIKLKWTFYEHLIKKTRYSESQIIYQNLNIYERKSDFLIRFIITYSYFNVMKKRIKLYW